MTITVKINLCRSIMDELAIIGYLDNEPAQLKALDFIRNELAVYVKPQRAYLHDTFLEMCKELANNPVKGLRHTVEKLTQLVEFALSDLEGLEKVV